MKSAVFNVFSSMLNTRNGFTVKLTLDVKASEATFSHIHKKKLKEHQDGSSVAVPSCWQTFPPTGWKLRILANWNRPKFVSVQ